MKKNNFFFTSSSAEETLSIGQNLAKFFFEEDALIGFRGNLGSGKTTLIKGIASVFIDDAERVITSPTFTYLQMYPIESKFLYHFDLYRLKDKQDFLARGFMDYLGNKGICCIEWPEVIDSLLPEKTWFIDFKYLDEGKRSITVAKV